MTLGGMHLFLSASFPSGERGQRYEPFDPGAIADAVTAVVRAVLVADGKLLFGGHPTITPLVLMVAKELDRKEAVDVFQSSWFEDQMTPETDALEQAGHGQIHWTPRSSSKEQSLHAMREQMLRHDCALAAGVFVGGMEGVVEEHEQFVEYRPGVPRVALRGPGGAAARLPLDEGAEILGGLVTSRRYPFVASRLVDRLAPGS